MLGRVAVDLTRWLTQPWQNDWSLDQPWEEAGTVLGMFADAFWDGDDPNIDWLLNPFAELIESFGRPTEQQLYAFVDRLGSSSEAVKRAICQWFYDTFESGLALVTALVDTTGAAVEEVAQRIWEWILFTLGMLDDFFNDLLAEYRDLVRLVERVAQSAPALIRPEAVWNQFLDASSSVAEVLQSGPRGLLRWAHQQAMANAQEVQIDWPLADEPDTVLRGTPITEVLLELLQGSPRVAQGFEAEPPNWEEATNPLLRWMQSVQQAAMGLLPQVADNSEAASEAAQDAVERAQRAVEQLTALEEQLWGFAFQGQGREHTGLTVVARSENVIYEGIQQSGGFEVDWDALRHDHSFLALEVLTGSAARLQLPNPTSVKQVDWDAMAAGCDGVPFEAKLPIDFDLGIFSQALDAALPQASIALCHLPEFFVIDMRYHMPYGKVGFYRILDPHKTGIVEGDTPETRHVSRVAQHAQEGTYDAFYDVNQDGVIDDEDVRLAEAQADGYAAGVVYRKTSAPLGLYASLSPFDWAFVAFTDLTEESIPGKIERRGILALVEGQIRLPIPDPYLFFATPEEHCETVGEEYLYPVRYHLEARYCVDHFPAFNPLQAQEGEEGGIEMGLFGWGPPFPIMQYDLVVRGGHECRDWQLYANFTPVNPLLRTWTIKLSFYLRGLLTGLACQYGAETGAGLAAKTDTRISIIYETGGPLIEVMQQWYDRIKELETAEIEMPSLPVPWQLLVDTIEYTCVPRICRNMIAIVAPFLDLFFEWTDEERVLRGTLGHLRQTILARWTPAPSWLELAAQLRSACAETPARQAALDALTGLQAELGNSHAGERARIKFQDEDAVYLPQLLDERIVAAVADLEGASEVLPWVEANLRDRPRFAASLDQLVPPTAIDAAATVIATSKATANFYPGVPAAPEVEIPGCGTFGVLNTHFLKPPTHAQVQAVEALVPEGEDEETPPSNAAESAESEETAAETESDGEASDGEASDGEASDVSSSAGAPSDPSSDGQDAAGTGAPAGEEEESEDGIGREEAQAVVDSQLVTDLTELRGAPFFRPCYGTVIEFGPDAALYSIPCADDAFFLSSVGFEMTGLVKGSRLLEDERGDIWLWVQVQDGRHGWLCIDRPLWNQLVGEGELPVGYVAGVMAQTLRAFVNPELASAIDRVVNGVLVPRPITRLEASSNHTMDESRYAHRAREALARHAAGQATETDEDFLFLYQTWIHELRIRVLGYEEAVEDMPEMGTAAWDLAMEELATGFNALGHPKREKLWSSAAAWMKCSTYLPIVAEEFADLIFEALLGDEEATVLERLERLGHALLEALKKCATFTIEEVILACQIAAPSIVDLVKVGFDIADKINDVQDMLAATGKRAEEGLEQVERFQKTREYDLEGEVGLPPVAEMWPGVAPDLQNAGAMLLRLLIAEPEQPKPGRPPWLPSWWDDVRLSVEAHGKLAESEDGAASESQDRQDVVNPTPPNVLEVCLGSPCVATVAYQHEPKSDTGAEADAQASLQEGPIVLQEGDRVILRVKVWGAIIKTLTSGQEILGEGADESRITPEMKQAVSWELKVGDGEFEELDLEGDRVVYEVGPEQAGQSLVFKAYLVADLASLFDAEPEAITPVLVPAGQYLFTHETIRLGYAVGGGGASAPSAPSEGESDGEPSEGDSALTDAGVDSSDATADSAEPTSEPQSESEPEPEGDESPADQPASEEPGDGEPEAEADGDVEPEQDGSETDTGAPSATITFLPGGQSITRPLPATGVLVLDLAQIYSEESANLQLSGAEDGLRIALPPGYVIEGRKDPEDRESDEEEEPEILHSGSVRLQLGKDSVAINWTEEVGAGVGLGDEAGSGVSLSPTGNIKWHPPQLNFPLNLLIDQTEDEDGKVQTVPDPQVIAMFLHFVSRFLYRSVDALEVLVHVLREEQEAGEEDQNWVAKGFGLFGRVILYLLFALVEALYDVAEDYAGWIAKLLDQCTVRFQFDALASISGTAYVNLDANVTLRGQAELNLASVLAPFIQVLMAADPRPPDEQEAQGLAEMLVPFIECEVRDHVCVKVGGFPMGLEVESQGKILHGSFGIPPDSPLKRRLVEMMQFVGTQAAKFKQADMGLRAAREAQDPQTEKGFAFVRLIIDLLDKQFQSMILEKDLDYGAFGGLVDFVMGEVAGKQARDSEAEESEDEADEADEAEEAEAMGILGGRTSPLQPASSPRAAEVLDALDKTFTDRVTGATRAPIGIVLAHGERLGDAATAAPGAGQAADGLWLVVDDEEKEALLDDLTPARPPQAVLETVRYTVDLPAAPRTTSWNTWVEDPEVDEALTGIVVGCDTEAEARRFLERPVQTDPGLPRAVWDRPDGRHYAWLDTELLPRLDALDLPLPELDLEGTTLSVTFRKVRAGALEALGPEIDLLAGAETERVTYWQVVLIDDVQPGDAQRIAERLARNRARERVAQPPRRVPPAGERASLRTHSLESAASPWAQARGKGSSR